MKYTLMVSAAALLLAGGAHAGGCPEATVADMAGVAPGAFPQQYELSEFQTAGNCTLSFQENPEIAARGSYFSHPA